MGRLFDAVSALLDIRGVIDYEAQAAIELEMAAYKDDDRAGNEVYPFTIEEDRGQFVIRLKELIAAVVNDLYHNSPKSKIAAKFHNTVARMIYEMCRAIAEEKKINQIALSGGVFQNRLLMRKVLSTLEIAGFRVLTHKQVPTNDGGVSLGQAVIANFS
jgi:hydrogenase maturation protein HypF